MYADKKHGLELATKYPATWDVWISRKNDKNVAIRLQFVECLKSLLMNLPVKRDVLGGTCISIVYSIYPTRVFAEALEAKLLDPDDKIRTAACKVFSQLDYESVLHNVSEGLLRAVAGRFLDKKVFLPLPTLSRTNQHPTRP
jgi:sister-chromatid-cohesion protein PDS5